MAIDTIAYPDATNLVHPQKSFYPVRIPVSHWQLRHYISTPEPDLLYYASGHDIYCLNTSSKKRKHVATLPFEARCTASGYGWVCVGGEDEGHFAAIKLDGSPAAAGRMEVDEALPVEQGWRNGGSGAAREGRRAASVKVERIGEEIVNSISIHRIQDEDAHLDDIVAVLTNNDKTVRVYSLPQNLETTVLDLPFAMNHATISPNGEMMVAVGDFNQAYFFSREIQETPPQIPKPHNRLTSSAIEWTLTSVVNLHGTDTTNGYFTTAWNPSGQLVAVGSEAGYITVFDMDILQSPDYDDEEAIVAVIKSSRPDLPQPHPGAVRSMMFSPEPWDLLIWAEDQGRVCVGDLRTGLKTKQTVELEPKDEKLEKLVFEDVPSDCAPHVQGVTSERGRDIDELEADFLRRYRSAPDNATAVNFATEYIEARRRQRQQRQDMQALRSVANAAGVSALEDDPQGLTAREQQILESLRTTRQREEARAAGGSIPRSVNYTTPDMFSHSRSSSAAPNHSEAASTSAAARPISEILSSESSALPASFPELQRTNAASPRPSSSHDREAANTLPPLREFNDGVLNQRSTTGIVRLADGSRLPRRRASVVLSPPTTNPPSTSSSAQASRPVPSIQAGGDDEENPWRTIEEHMTLARGPLFEGAARAQASSPAPAAPRPTDQELARELAAERARARSLARHRDRFRMQREQAVMNEAQNTQITQNAQNALRRSPGAAEQLRRLAAFPEGYEALLRSGRIMGRAGGEIGVRTAGLTMSPDGRRFWVACEQGIFEVGMNLKGRMFWPSVEPR